MSELPSGSAVGGPAWKSAPASCRRTWLFRLLLLLIAWGVFELASFVALAFIGGGMSGSGSELRRVAGSPTNLEDPMHREDSVHPYFGFVRRPRSGPLEPGETPINGFGFLDANPPIHHRQPGQVLVGIVGGSVAQEFCEAGLAELETQLKRSPRFANKRFAFVKLAIPGYKEPQQLFVIGYLLTLGAEFDLVLNIDGFNEIALPAVENVPSGVFPSFPRDWGERVLERKDLDVLRQMGEVVYLQHADHAWSRFFSFAPWSYSPTLRLVWLVRHQWLSRSILDGYRRTTVLREKQRSFTAQGPSQVFRDSGELIDHCVAVWRRSSLELAKICDGWRIEYHHFLQPNQYVAGSKPMGAQERSYAVESDYPARPTLEAGYPKLIAAGRELTGAGVRFHDLTQVFAHEKAPTYRDNCCHLNPSGNVLLARAIATAITGP